MRNNRSIELLLTEDSVRHHREQSQAEQGDLGQPRQKLAGTGDEHGEAALLAHGNRKSSTWLNTDVTLLSIVTPALLLSNQGCRV
jgi:hypothetical protein